MARTSWMVTSSFADQPWTSASSVTVVGTTSAWEAAMRCAMARRMPLSGSAGPASAMLLAARSTSARVMLAPGPLPWTRLRSTSSLRASARIAGSTCRPRARVGPAGPSASRAGSPRSISPTMVPVSCPPSLNSTSGAPTLTRSPLAPNIRAIVPLHGDGTSTTALSVSTETSGWLATTWSPSLTNQATISASSRPSPRSGNVNWRIAASRVSTERAGLAHCGGDARNGRHVLLLEPRKRHDGVVAGDAGDRRQQRQEAALGHEGSNLGAEPAGARRLVHDHATSGLGDRCQHGFLVVRFQRGEVDHLGADAVGGELVGSRQRFLHHCAPTDERDVATLAQDERHIQRKRFAAVLHLALDGAVDARRLQIHDRIGVADRRQQQPVSAFRR